MNKKILRSIMILHGDTRNSLAKYLNLTPTSLSYKMNESHGRCFDKAEIEAIAKKYELTSDQITDIFFTDFVS